MTSQMQQVADSGSGVVQVVGNDAFCIAALNGLNTVGYEGAVTSITQCITDATREGVAGDVLEGVYLTATMALGAADDPTFELYQAVMDAFGQEVQDADSPVAMGGYIAMASLDGITGDVTSDTVVETIKAMPETDLPGAGGMTYQCGGTVFPDLPAVCTNQSLRTRLDAEGQPTTYEIVYSTDLVSLVVTDRRDSVVTRRCRVWRRAPSSWGWTPGLEEALDSRQLSEHCACPARSIPGAPWWTSPARPRTPASPAPGGPTTSTRGPTARARARSSGARSVGSPRPPSSGSRPR